MRRQIWIVYIVVGLFAWLGLGPGFVIAQGAVIYPVSPQPPYGPITNSTVTLKIFNEAATTEITGSWLPIPNQPILVRVNGTTLGTAELLDNSNTPLTTSRYPGVCTNFGDPIDTSLDFDGPAFVPPDGFKLTPKDSGGRAVVRINGNYTFVIPQDSNLDGIPDIYEAQYGRALVRDADIDTGPDPKSPVGDGIANIDEYRGFRVGTQYVRGDPTRKDLFVHLEDTPQCTATAGTFTGQGGTVTLATFFPTGLGPLYSNVDTLAPDVLVHRINNDEWVSNFSSYDKNQLAILNPSTAESATTDRWINRNAISPLGAPGSSGRKFVKGVRIIQCLDLSALSPLGRSAKSPPDLFAKDNGNAILFVHRIVKSMLNAIKAGGTRQMRYFTHEGGAWILKSTTPAPSLPSNPSVTDPNVQSIMKIAFAWYLAHEALEHSYDVTAATEGTYGYHHADGSGTNVDVKITNKVDSKTTGFNNFYIPKYHGISDDRQMRVLSSQQLSP